MVSASASASALAVATFACGTTSLDSVVAEGVTSTAGSGAGGGTLGGSSGSAGAGVGGSEGGTFSGAGGSSGNDSGGAAAASGSGSDDCRVTMPAPGRYLVRDRVADRCLQKGDVDPVLHAPVYSALLDDDCSVQEAQWDFIEVRNDGYALHNTGFDGNLDVRAGSNVDGTPIVIYLPHPNQNQLFKFWTRTPPYFALEAQNAIGKCVQVVGTGAQLFPCDDTNQAQDFSLVRAACP